MSTNSRTSRRRTLSAVALLGLASAVILSQFAKSSRTVFSNTKSLPCGDNSRLTILKTGEDTNKEYFQAHYYSQFGTPGGYKGKDASPPLHVHDHHTECFEVIAGRLGCVSDGVEEVRDVGDQVCFPIGAHHTFWNAGAGTDLEVILTEKPSGVSELFFRNFCGLGHDAGSLSTINPLRAIMLFVYTDIRLSDLPLPVWKVIEHAVAPTLRFFRLAQPFYVEYSG